MMAEELKTESPAPAALTPEEVKRRKQRNLVVALSLAAFILLVFIVTILRLGGSVAERSFQG